MQDFLDQFKDAMETRGLVPPSDLIADGMIHRCNVEGPSGKGDGSYLLHIDNIPAGGFQNWQDGDGWRNWRADIGRSLTAKEEAENRSKIELAQRKRKVEEANRNAEAREKALQIWNDSSPCNEHTYLAHKGIRTYGGRVFQGNLVLPLRDVLGTLHSLQFIDMDGSKRFLSGGRVRGSFFWIGEANPNGVLCIAEGFATGASIHEATGYSVVVAFDCGNLLSVAKSLRKKFQDVKIVVCVDDDYQTPGNPGLTKAREVAQAVAALLATPDFGPNRPDGATDFNDLHQSQGLDAVRCCIEVALFRGPMVMSETLLVDDHPAEVTPILEKAKRADDSSAKRLTLVSLKDLLAEPEEHFDYLVDSLLPAGGLSLLSSKPKTGKSTLARQLTLAVARGEGFLGRKTEKGLSIYLALEERRGDVRSHFRKMGATGDENLKIFAGMSPLDGVNLLRKTAEYEKPALIVVDTLARLVRVKDMNDYSQVTSALEPLLALAREVGSHVLLLHHAKKGDGKGIDSILGSTGLAGSVDTIINLHRTDDYRTISSIQRDGNDIPETVLQFDSETRITTLGGSREQTEIDRVKNDILSFLSGQESPVTEKAVDEGVDGKTTYKRKALRQLVEDQKISRTGKGGRGSPYHYHVAETDSCSHVPNVSVEQGNKNLKHNLTDCNSKGNACSTNFALFGSCSQDQRTPMETPGQEVVRSGPGSLDSGISDSLAS